MNGRSDPSVKSDSGETAAWNDDDNEKRRAMSSVLELTLREGRPPGREAEVVLVRVADENGVWLENCDIELLVFLGERQSEVEKDGTLLGG